MAWVPTNANDVVLTISQVVEGGPNTTELTNTNIITVDEFSLDEEEDLSALSGVSNANPLGITQGDVEYTFSFTVQGEDAELFTSLATDDGRAVELQIQAVGENYKKVLGGARAGTRNFSASSGDATEYEVEGMATSSSESVIGSEDE